MRDFEFILEERADEVQTHLDFIRSLEAAATGRSEGGGMLRVDAEPINILKSGFLVHLYNVVEAVMTKALEEVEIAAKVYPPRKWRDGLLKEWAKARLNLKRDITAGQAEERVFDLLQEAAGRRVVDRLRIERKGGNWSHEEVQRITSAISCPLDINAAVETAACVQIFEDDLVPLKYIRAKRNRLAHGEESFVDGARHLTSDRLEALRAPVIDYMREVVASFNSYLDGEGFLITEQAAS